MIHKKNQKKILSLVDLGIQKGECHHTCGRKKKNNKNKYIFQFFFLFYMYLFEARFMYVLELPTLV